MEKKPEVSTVACPVCRAAAGEPCKKRKPPKGTEPICKHPPEYEGYCCFHGQRYGALDEAKKGKLK